jgi:hypothetical protein
MMGRTGQGRNGAMLRGALGYGITENLKVSLSAPVVFTAEPLAPARMSAFTPMTGDIEGLLTWRFHRKDTGVGSRVESAVIGGVLIPGPQEMGGVLRNVESGVGEFIGGVTGFASRSNYFWVGGSYQRYAESDRDTRPDLLAYTVAYAYRPRSWRTDTGWDWRIFGELTGERSGHIERRGGTLPGTDSHQLFFRPHNTWRVQELRRFGRYSVSCLPRSEPCVRTRAISLERERCLLLLKENHHEEKSFIGFNCAPSRRVSNSGGSPPDGALYLRHGLNDMRLRGPRGSPEIIWC